MLNEQREDFADRYVKALHRGIEAINKDWETLRECSETLIRLRGQMKTTLSIKVEDNKTCSLWDSYSDTVKINNLTPEQATKIKELVEEFHEWGIRKGHNHVVLAVRALPFPEDEC